MGESDVSSEECRAQAVAWFMSSEKTIAEIASTLNLSESVVREWVWRASPEDVSDKPRPEAGAVAQAETEVARVDTAAASAAAIEAVLRAEVMAAEAVARAEAVAAEAKAAAADARAQVEAAQAELEAARAEIAVRVAAEAALREEIRAVYAEAVEAITRAEAAADERVARAEAATTEALMQARAVDAGARAVDGGAPAVQDAMATEARPAAAGAFTRAQAARIDAVASREATSLPTAAPAVPAAEAKPRRLDRSEEEAEARAKIAEVTSRAAPVELWVHATGRTFEAARDEVLDRLGVEEAQAEIEVLAEGSRWLSGRVQIRARVRVAENLRLIRGGGQGGSER